MTDFIKFRNAVEKSFEELAEKGNLFYSDINKDSLWDSYLQSFPEGTNPMYRERTEHDCQCCKSFIRNVGRVVSVIDDKLVSVWDNLNIEGTYRVVSETLSALIHEKGIAGIYLNDESFVGRKQSPEILEGGSVKLWEHFYAALPTKAYSKRGDVASRKGSAQTNCKVLMRSLKEISPEAVTLVEDLISQNMIHRGNEYRALVAGLKSMQHEVLDSEHPELTIWNKTVEMIKNNRECNIRGTAIGTLLVDLTEGVELEVAVKKYEDKVSGTNYKRTTALVTQGMIDKAHQTVKELGLEQSFSRRYANKTDMNVNDVLFADDSVKPFMEDSIFSVVEAKAPTTVPDWSKIEEMSAEDFISRVLPKATSIEAFLESSHESNLVSLIAPTNPDSKVLMKWGNNFSWNYSGEVAESVTRQRVKAAGGVVDAPLRFSISWSNRDDLDLHLAGENGHVYFVKRSQVGFTLDVDMRGEQLNQVENIFCDNLENLVPGSYKVYVHNFYKNSERRGEKSTPGFVIEAEIKGSVQTIVYDRAVRNKENIDLFELTVYKDKSVVIQPLMESTSTSDSREIWGLNTNQFHKVDMIMRSPNMWEASNKSGNDHLFFMLEGCVNKDDARGFYNEFLPSELTPHRKVFEILSSKMKAQYSEEQLSGLGFSSTLRNQVVLRVKGSFNRVIKVNF